MEFIKRFSPHVFGNTIADLRLSSVSNISRSLLHHCNYRRSIGRLKQSYILLGVKAQLDKQIACQQVRCSTMTSCVDFFAFEKLFQIVSRHAFGFKPLLRYQIDIRSVHDIDYGHDRIGVFVIG
ncbi:hypothetical protein D3C73_1212660 [compost metagenome]